jgi:hypothetical protein
MHFHPGTVVVYTVEGAWTYDQGWVSEAGDVVFEVAGSTHSTRMVGKEDTIVFCTHYFYAGLVHDGSEFGSGWRVFGEAQSCKFVGGVKCDQEDDSMPLTLNQSEIANGYSGIGMTVLTMALAIFLMPSAAGQDVAVEKSMANKNCGGSSCGDSCGACEA